MTENQADHIEIASPILEQQQLRVWHLPEISRIDIKNTLTSTGSFIDGGSGSRA